MNTRAQAAILPGGRLHLHDGPIDLIIGADGERVAVRAAYAAAAARFGSVLDELCAELPLLRHEMHANAPLPIGTVARRMDRAVRQLAATRFITRMAAVAGAVADEVLAALCAQATLTRAYVNNGGDIALHVAKGASLDIGLVDAPDRAALLGSTRIAHADGVRGVATSGRGGRSFSLGIADAVTVLAADAASADAAATLIANAVDLPGHPAVCRQPACERDPQSDLGARLITREVGPLAPDEINAALRAGAAEAERLRSDGFIASAFLSLRGRVEIVGTRAPTHLPGLLPHAV